MDPGERSHEAGAGVGDRPGAGVAAATDAHSVLQWRSPSMQSILARVHAVAHTSAPVLLLGETGTGKEVLARAIHACGPRAARPFVPVNCGALPGELLESELFGHVRGAFSGATANKEGLFEAADGGTLLLDEVADLPLPLQVKLLRVLQDGEVRGVGSNRPHRVDVRVIAATHREIDDLVGQELFRTDLLYRLRVFSFKLPPLRERSEDILPLAREFLARERGASCRLASVTEALLLNYPWPGNVRELSNAMRYAAALGDGEFIGPHHLPEEIVCLPAAANLVPLQTLAEVEREHVLTVLRACGEVQATAARILGIARNTLGRKLRAYRSATRLPPAPIG